MTAVGIERENILFEDLSYELSTKMLAEETLERLNCNRTGFDFKGYNVKIPGYICLPVKISKNVDKRRNQHKELLALGYKKLSQELASEYKLAYDGKEIYIISIEKLMEIHNIEH